MTTRKFGKETYFSVKRFVTEQSWGFSHEAREVALQKVYREIEEFKTTMPGYKFRIAKYPTDIFVLFAKKIEP